MVCIPKLEVIWWSFRNTIIYTSKALFVNIPGNIYTYTNWPETDVFLYYEMWFFTAFLYFIFPVVISSHFSLSYVCLHQPFVLLSILLPQLNHEFRLPILIGLCVHLCTQIVYCVNNWRKRNTQTLLHGQGGIEASFSQSFLLPSCAMCIFSSDLSGSRGWLWGWITSKWLSYHWR